MEQLWPGASRAGRHAHQWWSYWWSTAGSRAKALALGLAGERAHRPCGRMRAAEIAVCVAGHVAALGYDARAHWAGQSEIDLDKASILAGLAVRTDRECAILLDDRFSWPPSLPITRSPAMCRWRHAWAAPDLRYFLGWSGALGTGALATQPAPPTWYAYPMEDLRRVDRPTADPRRGGAAGTQTPVFARAAFRRPGRQGAAEVKEFAGKQPLAAACISPMMKLVGESRGAVADAWIRWAECDGGEIAHLGATSWGICEIPDYAWYNHQVGGEEIIPYHKYAIVVVIDQGFDTMEGATGDDWISGVQSMRAYICAARRSRSR